LATIIKKVYTKKQTFFNTTCKVAYSQNNAHIAPYTNTTKIRKFLNEQKFFIWHILLHFVKKISDPCGINQVNRFK